MFATFLERRVNITERKGDSKNTVG